MTWRNEVELQHFVNLISNDLPFERLGPVGLGPYGQSVWRSDDFVLRWTDDAKGTISHRRMRLEHVTNLHVQKLGSLIEVEVLEGVTTRVVR